MCQPSHPSPLTWTPISNVTFSSPFVSYLWQLYSDTQVTFLSTTQMSCPPDTFCACFKILEITGIFEGHSTWWHHHLEIVYTFESLLHYELGFCMWHLGGSHALIWTGMDLPWAACVAVTASQLPGTHARGPWGGQVVPRTQVQIGAYQGAYCSWHGVPQLEASSVQGQKCRPVLRSIIGDHAKSK